MTAELAPLRLAEPREPRGGLLHFSGEHPVHGEVSVLRAPPELPGLEALAAAAAACAALSHPGLVRVHEVSREGGLQLVTEPLRTSLDAQLAASGPLEASRVLAEVPALCEALELLAARGVGPVALGAGEVEADGALRALGFLPSARPVAVELGALLCEALCGAPPPAQGLPELVGVRPALAKVVQACLTPQGPYKTAADVARALQGAGVAGTAAERVAKDARHDTVVRPQGGGGAAGRVGEVVGSYELLERLGEGGMGEVYRARHVRLGREVAVKLLLPQFAREPELVQRFFDEARVVNQINHPHIVEISDFVEEPQRAYCVMELLRGRTLSTLARQEGPLPLRRVASLMAQVCEALQAAHDKGVVHRDVKPDNVFVLAGEGDFVKVLDFGVAKLAPALAGPRAERTAVGTVIGTPLYMSPEQALARPVDARADLYALGAVLHELLTGALPSAGAGVGELKVALSGEPIPERWAQLVRACLELEPTRRPASATAVAQALQEAAAPLALSQEVQVVPPPARWRAPLALLVGAPLVIAAASVGGWWSMRAPPVTPSPTPVTPSPTPVTPSGVEGPAPSSEAAGTEREALAPATLDSARGEREQAPSPLDSARGERGTPKPKAQLARRVKALRALYDGLVKRHGAHQLTAIEREAIRQVVEEYEAGRYDRLARSLGGAEAAVAAARRRLEP